jgi:hypothetical protein
MIPIIWSQGTKVYPQFSQSRCLVELACTDTEDNPALDKKPVSRSALRGDLPPPRTPDLKSPFQMT